MWRFLGLLLLLSAINVESETFRPKRYGFEDTFYSLVNTKNKAEFRETYANYMSSIRNESIDPCANFYEYACGNWANVVTPRNSTYYSSFESMGHGMVYVLFKLLSEEINEEDVPGTVVAKKFFNMCLQSDTWDKRELVDFVDSLGPWPLTSDSWSPDQFEWLNSTAYAHAYMVRVIFKQTFRNSESAWTGNFLGVLKEDAVQIFCKSKNVSDRETFVLSIIEEFKELGVNVEGREDMLAEVYDFEQHLVELVSATKGDNELHEHKLENLHSFTTNYSLSDYFTIIQGRSVSPNSAVRVENLDVLKELFSFISRTDKRPLANTIFLNFILKFLQALQKIKEDRGLQCVKLAKEKLLEPVLSMFVEKYYDNDSIAEMDSMLYHLMGASREVIWSNEWLTNATKVEALAKLDAVQKKVGFKEREVDIDALRKINIDEGGFISNLLKVYRYRVIQDQKTPIGFDWFDTPFTVNAHFMPMLSILSVPLGVIQPPFFHKFSPRFVNYGALGATVGHEIMHAFDMNGIEFAANGEIFEWFDPRLKRELYIKIGCFLLQYENHSMLPVLNATVDGENTLNENVADNEGFQVALKAYKNWLESQTNESDIDKGLLKGDSSSLNNLQAFFLSFAQGWCASLNEAGLRKMLNGPHAPDDVRANEVLANSPDFASAFNCPVGSKMNPIKKCRYLKK